MDGMPFSPLREKVLAINYDFNFILLFCTFHSQIPTVLFCVCLLPLVRALWTRVIRMCLGCDEIHPDGGTEILYLHCKMHSHKGNRLQLHKTDSIEPVQHNGQNGRLNLGVAGLI